ncbi:MAG: cupin domain-containing protein [Actinobacteria bacterium]|nr:cupin domain-containing protein [Actinomycetota bacterium]
MDGLRRINLFELVPEYDESDPEGYRVGATRLGPALGASQMGASLYDLPPGQSICPYHYEYPEEEWLVVLAGHVTLRHPGGEDELGRGDIVCFPSGPDGAHKVTCLGDETARVVISSTKQTPAIAVYPDSGKVGIWPGDDRDRLMMRREMLEYYDGEV